jgi:hypothetical protein
MTRSSRREQASRIARIDGQRARTAKDNSEDDNTDGSKGDSEDAPMRNNSANE